MRRAAYLLVDDPISVDGRCLGQGVRRDEPPRYLLVDDSTPVDGRCLGQGVRRDEPLTFL